MASTYVLFMLAKTPLMAFVATCDGTRARRFYGYTLGLPILADDAYALVCDANGTTLRIQKADALVAGASRCSAGR